MGNLIDYLAAHQEQYGETLLTLLIDVSEMTAFEHLERLDGGAQKVEAARSAVDALREIAKGYSDFVRTQEETGAQRQLAYARRLRNEEVRQKLEELKQMLYAMVPTSPQSRGYELERLLRDLFELFDLDPKASFRIVGEQIDGAFTFDSTDYLLEAKWQREPVGLQGLDAFKGKVERKLENTLGLYLSINGFQQTAVAAHSTSRPKMILMEGSDLMAVLEGRIDLLELLLRKRRHAAQTGEVLIPIHRILI